MKKILWVGLCLCASGCGDDAGGAADTGAMGPLDAASTDGGHPRTPSSTADATVPTRGGMDASMDATMDSGADGGADSGDLGWVCDEIDAGDDDAGGALCHCAPRGNEARHIIVNVQWPANTGLAAGAAELHLWQKADLTFAGDGSVTGTVMPCGIVEPEFQKMGLAGMNKTKLEFPDATFDSPGIPTGMTTGMLAPPAGSDDLFAIGASIMMDPVGLNIGIRLADPINDPWLTMGMGSKSLSMAVDDDGDGSPGITAVPLKDATHDQPPVSIFAALPPLGGTMPAGPFADKLYLVVRLVVQLMGVRDTCMTAKGLANVMKLDTRVVGCHSTAGVECTAAESDFIDANQAVMTVVDAKYEMQIVPATTTCAEIRTMLPAM